MTTIRKTIKFDSNDKIIIKLTQGKLGATLSMSGDTDFSVGQNYDEFYYRYITNKPKFTKKAETMRLLEIWKKYNFNDMSPGTSKQMEALEDKDYDGYVDMQSVSEYLDSLGLLVDDGYKYGTDWLFLEIPNEIIKELEDIVNNW